MQPYMSEETLKRIMLLENRIAEKDGEIEGWKKSVRMRDRQMRILNERIAELEISEEKYRMNAMDLEEEKDRRLALLREICEIEPCPMCWGWKTHSDKCPIEKELSDE